MAIAYVAHHHMHVLRRCGLYFVGNLPKVLPFCVRLAEPVSISVGRGSGSGTSTPSVANGIAPNLRHGGAPLAAVPS
jgi:hypothetical protein